MSARLPARTPARTYEVNKWSSQGLQDLALWGLAGGRGRSRHCGGWVV